MRVTNKSTYQDDYTKPPFSKVQPLPPSYLEFSSPPEGGNWLDERTLEQETFGNAEEKIKAMYKKRYVSCYQRDYCRAKSDKEEELNVKTLLDYCKEIYLDGNPAVLPPLQTARRLYGYMNPSLFKSDLTAYQADYGKTGYKLLEQNANRAAKVEVKVADVGGDKLNGVEGKKPRFCCKCT